MENALHHFKFVSPRDSCDKPLMSLLKTCVAVAALGLAAGSSANAAIVLNTGFEEVSFAATGLTDFSNITVPTLTLGAGISGSKALDFGSDGASVTGSMTIAEISIFSMFGKYNGSAGTSAGTMGFGWTKATGDFNPFNGSGTGVVPTNHVTVGVARSAGNIFRLAVGNGTTGSMNTFFGNTVGSLTSGNFYRLEGTVLYNSLTGTFTFNDVSLDDFGATGSTLVTADILSGTGQTLTVPGFGDTARGLFVTNRDRGFQVTDNYYLETVPEPVTSGMVAMGALTLLLRRRRL